jgi:hypothetical protein
VALVVKKYVDEAMRVQIVGQPAPEIKDLEYYQVRASAERQRGENSAKDASF